MDRSGTLPGAVKKEHRRRSESGGAKQCKCPPHHTRTLPSSASRSPPSSSPVFRSGKTKTVALPATSLRDFTLTAATAGSIAASYCTGSGEGP